MLSKRVIPCLLLNGKGLVKTRQFKNEKYIGDPINAIKIFNEKEVDELTLLDISASIQGKEPNYEMIKHVASECFMPLGYGGGIKTSDQAKHILSLGVEKIILNSVLFEEPKIVEELSKIVGSQSVVVSIDVKKNIFGKYEVYKMSGKINTKLDPVKLAKTLESQGAGEILVTSIDRDGTMIGYDVELIKKVTSSISIPLIACGGAGSVQHFSDAIDIGGASAVAAGSMFVYQGKHRAVLISYPNRNELKDL